MHSRHIVRTVTTALAALACTIGFAVPASAVGQSDAAAQFRAAGIGWTSSGGCTNQGNPTCTSFSGIRQATIDGAETLKSASGCSLTITGGTETGHAGGTYSHGTGYKLDFHRTGCLDGYVTSAFSYIGPRGDGAALYEAASGNLYANEGSHWDVVFYSCGGC